MPEQIEAELTVEPQTVVDALRLNQQPGTKRQVVFYPDHEGEHTNPGQCRDVSDVSAWGTDTSPITLHPELFFEEPKNLAEERSLARGHARMNDEDVDEWESKATDVWESNMHGQLKNVVTVQTYQGDVHYEITYIEEDDQ